VLDTYSDDLIKSKKKKNYLAKHDWYLFGKLMLDAKFSWAFSDNLSDIAYSLIEMKKASNDLVKDNARRLMEALQKERDAEAA